MISGTITESDETDEDWKSQTYVVEVREGFQYLFDLTALDGDVVGVWSPDLGDYIIEVSPSVTTRSVPYVFSEGGKQELFIQSPAPHVPSPFTFKIWSPRWALTLSKAATPGRYGPRLNLKAGQV